MTKQTDEDVVVALQKICSILEERLPKGMNLPVVPPKRCFKCEQEYIDETCRCKNE